MNKEAHRLSEQAPFTARAHSHGSRYFAISSSESCFSSLFSSNPNLVQTVFLKRSRSHTLTHMHTRTHTHTLTTK